MLRNHTPHRIALHYPDGRVEVLPPAMPTIRIPALTVASRAGDIDGMPVVHERSGSFTPRDFPGFDPDVTLIVSRVVAERVAEWGGDAVKWRFQVMYPTDLVRDATGNVIGCRALGSVAG